MKKFKSFYEDMTFRVEVEGLPALFMSGNSPGQVKNHLRKLIKQPSMIKSVERQTKHDVKKMYRKKAQGKDIDEGTMGDKPEWGTPESTRKAKKMTPGETCESNCGCDKCKRKMDEKLTIGKIRRAAYKTGKVLGDVNAVKKGKVAKRVKNRVVGKLLGKAVGKLGLFK